MAVTETTPKTKHLPSPDERREADVLIYDGDCRFCASQVWNVHRFDRGGRVAFISLHDPKVAERYPDLSKDQLMEQMYIVDQRGDRHAGAGAFRYLTRRLPTLWWLAPLMHIPFSLPLWNWCYRQVAKRRYLFGKTRHCDGDACAIHFRK